jgi:hypothetical protein
MVFLQSTRCLTLALACAWLGGCSNSSKTATPVPPATSNGDTSPAPATGTGGNGTTTPEPTPSPTDGGEAATDSGNSAPMDGGTTALDGGTGSTTPPPVAMTHHRCGWMNDDIALGKASFLANIDFFDAIHPYWWTLGANGTVSAGSWVDDATVVSTSASHKVKLMPLVYGGDDATAIRAVLA